MALAFCSFILPPFDYIYLMSTRVGCISVLFLGMLTSIRRLHDALSIVKALQAATLFLSVVMIITTTWLLVVKHHHLASTTDGSHRTLIHEMSTALWPPSVITDLYLSRQHIPDEFGEWSVLSTRSWGIISLWIFWPCIISTQHAHFKAFLPLSLPSARATQAFLTYWE